MVSTNCASLDVPLGALALETERILMTARRLAAVMIAAAAAICPLTLAGSGQAAAGPLLPNNAHGAAVAGTWQTAKNVPGVMALNKGGQAETESPIARSGCRPSWSAR
jgi:hypothetical protein